MRGWACACPLRRGAAACRSLTSMLVRPLLPLLLRLRLDLSLRLCLHLRLCLGLGLCLCLL